MPKKKEIRVKMSASVIQKIDNFAMTTGESEDKAVLFFLHNRFKLPFFAKKV